VGFTPEMERRLADAGYRYHCFISYPRVRSKELLKCARRVKEAIEGELSLTINQPAVFLDENIKGGTDWELKLRQALCQSLTMVAICAPIYYHPAHKWCGLEWAAMEGLNEKRLPGNELRTIIPIIFRRARENAPPPRVISKPQQIDISDDSLLPGFYSTSRFNKHIRGIVSHIEQVVDALVGNDSNMVRTDCAGFPFPLMSAFADCPEIEQAPPFHESNNG
jgi:hypothetical protein